MEPRSYYEGMRVSECKRQNIVNTTRLLLAAVITTASIHGRDGVRMVLAKLLGRFLRLRVILADAAYARWLVAWAQVTG